MAHIVIIDPGAIVRVGHDYYLPERSYLGYEAYRSYLQQEATDVRFTVVSLHPIETVSREEVEKRRWVAALNLEIAPQPAQDYVRQCGQQTLVLSLLTTDTKWLVEEKVKTVYLVENTRKNKTLLTFSQGSFTWLGKMRIILGSYRIEGQLQKAAKKAVGLQCNGDAAYKAYGKHHANAILFYDHRVHTVFETQDSGREFKNGNSISLAFSGRIIKIKGSGYLADISQRLFRADPNIKLYVLGDGEDREKVLAAATPNLVYKGFMSYENEWEPFVQENVDIMLLPHTQGDPSMTYFESLGQGVPIIGFDNETLTPLAHNGLGWVAPQGDIDGLVNTIMFLNGNPQAVREKQKNSVAFMKGNVYSAVVKKRMDHLIALLAV
ncbi:MAG: glycosyltransferase [Rothia sp. (in: high G+C Gram-positive bacteria)]|nr:glycosyltransferase [Rothia sp. (in: high G+C Gram-positive bacteria)]